MAKVFISHTSSDTELARRIARALKKRQVDVLLDDWLVKPGEKIFERLREGTAPVATAEAGLTHPHLQSAPSAVFGCAVAVDFDCA